MIRRLLRLGRKPTQAQAAAMIDWNAEALAILANIPTVQKGQSK